MKLLKFLLSFAFILFAQLGHASLQDSLLSGFDDATLTGAPGTYKVGDRTVTTGGYIRIRVPMSPAPNLLAITPPSIKGGCNGIDVYGGSFSLISKDELISWLENVTSNAGALATFTFVTFIKDQCSACSDGMEWLYQLQDTMNKTLMGSCDAANMIVGGLSGDSTQFDDYKQQLSNSYSDLGTKASHVDDKADAMFEFNSGAVTSADMTSAATASGMTDKNEALMVTGANISFWLTQKGGFAELISGQLGGLEDKEDVVLPLVFSIIGSSIYKVSAENTIIDPIEPWIDFDTLNNYDAAVVNKTMALKCPDVTVADPGNGCASPASMDFKLDDLKSNFVKMMEGDAGSQGIVAKLGLTDGGVAAAYTVTERTFMAKFGSHSTFDRLDVLSRIPEEKNKYYQEVKDRFLISYIHTWLSHFLDAAHQAAFNIQWPNNTELFSSDLMKRIDARIKLVDRQYYSALSKLEVTNLSLDDSFRKKVEAMNLLPSQ